MRLRGLLLLALLPGATFAQPAHEGWFGFRNGHQNEGRSSVAFEAHAARREGRQPWSFATGGLIWGTPVIDPAGNVYVGSADKRFYSLTSAGALRWSYTLPDAGDALIDSAATLTLDGLVVVPGGDGQLHALRQSTGELVWRFAAHHANDHEGGAVVNSFEGNVTMGPNGHLYAGSDNGHLYALDRQGRERWSFATGMMIWSAPAFDPQGRWLTFGSLDRKLYVVEAHSGKELASFAGGGEFKSSPAVGPDGRIYVGCSDGKVRGLELVDGKRLQARWTFRTRGEVYGSPALAGDRVVIGSHDGFVYCLSAADGRELWRYGTYARISASPLVTADGVVIVGTKAGRLYALDLERGTRRWSFQLTPGARKSNLDSSPALGPDGRVVVGSYDGHVYSLPLEFPFEHPDDPRADLDPGADLPDFGEVPADGATLRLVAADGTLHARAPAPIHPHSPLVLKLIAHDDGRYLPEAGVSAWFLSATTDPDQEVECVVASDSHHLTVFPRGFWRPGQRTTLTVRGRWFTRSNPFVDALKWVLPRFEARIEFEVAPGPTALPEPAPGTLLRYSVRDLYLAQPEILDTLVPAAMDGQAFIASLPLVDRASGKLGAVALPAYPRPDGSVVLRAAPEKVFFLNGSFQGDSVRLAGPVRMAAMGGEFQLDPMRMFARLREDGLEDGAVHGTACLLKIKGNGSTYTGLSWSAIDDMADSKLRLQAIGTLGGRRLASPALPVRLSAGLRREGGTVQAELELTAAVADEHLLVAVAIDDAKGEIAGVAAQVVGPAAAGTRLRPALGGLPAGRVVLLWDGELVPGSAPAPASSASPPAPTSAGFVDGLGGR